VVLPSRAALAESLQPYPSDTVERTRAVCVALADERARARRREAVAAGGRAPERRREPEREAVPELERTTVRASEGVQVAPGAVLIRQREALHDRDPDHGGVSVSSAGSFAGARVGSISVPAWPRLNGCEVSHDRRLAEPEAIDLGQDLTLDWTEVRALWQLADQLGGEVAGPGWQLQDEQAARLLLGITDVRVRDYLATWCATERAGQAVALAVELARRSVTAEQAAAGYSVAAWASWALGWGAWASLTLERALAAVPDYSLAVLIQTGLARGVGPALVRVASHGTAKRLAGMAQDQG
jgi:hypothetical protein